MIRQPRTTKTNETNSSEKNGGARRTRVRSAPSSFFSFFFFRSSPFNVSRCTPFSSDICCSRPRDEPLSKNVRHCRRQLSPSGNSPPPPTSCFSFFFFLFCFFFFRLSANFCLPPASQTSLPREPPNLSRISDATMHAARTKRPCRSLGRGRLNNRGLFEKSRQPRADCSRTCAHPVLLPLPRFLSLPLFSFASSLGRGIAHRVLDGSEVVWVSAVIDGQIKIRPFRLVC